MQTSHTCQSYYNYFFPKFDVISLAFGAAGQRCMALSTAVLVGESASWSEELVDLARGLKVSAG